MLSLHGIDMAEMSRSERSSAEKVFGALLADKGCLRKQASLREQLQRMTTDAPAMRLHGPRLFAAMQAGLPFLPEPKEMYVRATQMLNRMLAFKLKPDASLETVSGLLSRIEDAIYDDVPGRMTDGDFCRHLEVLVPPGKGKREREGWLHCYADALAANGADELSIADARILFETFWQGEERELELYNSMPTFELPSGRDALVCDGGSAMRAVLARVAAPA